MTQSRSRAPNSARSAARASASGWNSAGSRPFSTAVARGWMRRRRASSASCALTVRYVSVMRPASRSSRSDNARRHHGPGWLNRKPWQV